MTGDIMWWDLAGSGQTIESLQEDLRDGSVEPWQDVEGLRLKLWIADREHDRWGAIMWWEPDRPTDRPLPPNRAAELIGAPPPTGPGSRSRRWPKGSTRHPLPLSIPDHSQGSNPCMTIWLSTPSPADRSKATRWQSSSTARTSAPN